MGYLEGIDFVLLICFVGLWDKFVMWGLWDCFLV